MNLFTINFLLLFGFQGNAQNDQDLFRAQIPVMRTFPALSAQSSEFETLFPEDVELASGTGTETIITLPKPAGNKLSKSKKRKQIRKQKAVAKLLKP